MTDTYNSLCDIIHSKYIIHKNVLEEPNIMDIPITGIPSDAKYTLYRLDPDKGDIFPFFKDKKSGGPQGLKYICDYIMLVDFDDQLFIFLIELKRQKDLHAIEQLEATKVLVNYIIKSAQRINKPIDKDCIKCRQIQINKIKKKRPTQVRDIEYDDRGYINYPWEAQFYIRALLK